MTGAEGKLIKKIEEVFQEQVKLSSSLLMKVNNIMTSTRSLNPDLVHLSMIPLRSI